MAEPRISKLTDVDPIQSSPFRLLNAQLRGPSIQANDENKKTKKKMKSKRIIREERGYDEVNTNKKFWEELIAYFPLIRYGPHRKDASINVLTQPLPRNDRKMHIQTHGLIGGIYEVRRSDWFRCHDVRTKFHKNWFRQSTVDRRDSHTRTQKAWRCHKPTFILQNKESRLKGKRLNMKRKEKK
jgi:hypothetical protein